MTITPWQSRGEESLFAQPWAHVKHSGHTIPSLLSPRMLAPPFQPKGFPELKGTGALAGGKAGKLPCLLV